MCHWKNHVGFTWWNSHYNWIVHSQCLANSSSQGSGGCRCQSHDVHILGMRLLTSPSRENSTRKSSPLHEVKRNVHNNKVNIHYIVLILWTHTLCQVFQKHSGHKTNIAQMKALCLTILLGTQHYKLVTHYSYNYIIFLPTQHGLTTFSHSALRQQQKQPYLGMVLSAAFFSNTISSVAALDWWRRGLTGHRERFASSLSSNRTTSNVHDW